MKSVLSDDGCLGQGRSRDLAKGGPDLNQRARGDAKGPTRDERPYKHIFYAVFLCALDLCVTSLNALLFSTYKLCLTTN